MTGATSILSRELGLFYDPTGLAPNARLPPALHLSARRRTATGLSE
jgi:hypothetical protein